MTQTAADFPRAFAAAFGAQDAQAIAALFVPEGSFHLLTGAFAESQEEITALLAGEFAGLSRMARLVTGKTTFIPLANDITLLHQRYVVTGLRDATGQELARIGALLSCVLRQTRGGWLAQHGTFAALED